MEKKGALHLKISLKLSSMENEPFFFPSGISRVKRDFRSLHDNLCCASTSTVIEILETFLLDILFY